MYEFFSSVEHKIKYLEECWQPDNRGHPLTSIVKKYNVTIFFIF